MRSWRVPVWLGMVGAALLAALLTLTLDRALLARRVPPTPSPSPVPSTTPRPRVDVVVTTPEPLPSPSPPSDAALRDLLAASNTQMSGMLLLKAERHVELATEALLLNNAADADSELVAANASLNEALRYAPEAVKPPITNERLMIGQIRADLDVDPRDLDQQLRYMRNRLLALVPEVVEP